MEGSRDAPRGTKGAILLGNWPLPLVRLSCEKCGRTGQYHTAGLIARFGADYPMTRLRHDLVDCERMRAMKYDDACGAIYTDALAAIGYQPRLQRS
jgi:hypothetical protein